MKIISERQRVTQTNYSLDFRHRDMPSAGFSFQCDENGKLLPFTNEAAEINCKSCLDGTYDVEPIGVIKNSWTYTEPAVGICERCGKKVRLVDDYCGATECECGQWYAVGGYAIKPPEMWEEDVEYAY